MKPLLMHMAANEVREVGVSGTLFELRTAPYVVAKIELLDANNAPVGIMEAVEATDKERLTAMFHTVKVTNGPTAQSIRFYYGTGDASSNRFTGVISGEVDLTVATLATLDAMLQDAREPYAHNGFSNTSVLLTYNVPEVVLLPAANVNGLIVLGAWLTNYESAQQVDGGLYAAAAAPVTVNDGVPLALIMPRSLNTSNSFYGAELTTPAFVPAGLGLYWITDQPQSAGGTRAVRWRLL